MYVKTIALLLWCSFVVHGMKLFIFYINIISVCHVFFLHHFYSVTVIDHLLSDIFPVLDCKYAVNVCDSFTPPLSLLYVSCVCHLSSIISVL